MRVVGSAEVEQQLLADGNRAASREQSEEGTLPSAEPTAAATAALLLEVRSAVALTRLDGVRHGELARRYRSVLALEPSLAKYHAAIRAVAGDGPSTVCGSPRTTALLVGSLACEHLVVYGAAAGESWLECESLEAEAATECELLRSMSAAGLLCHA